VLSYCQHGHSWFISEFNLQGLLGFGRPKRIVRLAVDWQAVVGSGQPPWQDQDTQIDLLLTRLRLIYCWITGGSLSLAGWARLSLLLPSGPRPCVDSLSGFTLQSLSSSPGPQQRLGLESSKDQQLLLNAWACGFQVDLPVNDACSQSSTIIIV